MGASVVACAPVAPPEAAPPAPTSVAIATMVPKPTANATAIATPVPVTRTPIASTGPITLTLWTTEALAPGTTSAGRILRNQFDAFSAANTDIHIDVVLKKPSGKGGLLDFLTTTRAVVPARLPDLVTLDLSEVPLAAEAGILQPLDGWMPAELNADFFPFASKAARYRNQWMAVPFVANVEHLVYNKAIIRQVPRTWDDFTKQKASLLLPLGGDDAFLLQYFALGVSLSDASNQTAIDVNATAQVLGFFKRARDLGLIPDTALSLKTVEEVWSGFAAGQVAMAQIPASRYLTERGKLPNALYAHVPTREGKPATIATGWAFVIVTNDPARQSAAARFIQWIIQGERLAPWLRAAHLLPASRAALVLAVDPPEYASFLRDELEHASPLPPASSYSKQSDAWRAAIVAVWKGQTTPQEAARNAATLR
jgi:ABC-type glycerol-3-phosphate transport system substrate-binding protein